MSGRAVPIRSADIVKHRSPAAWPSESLTSLEPVEVAEQHHHVPLGEPGFGQEPLQPLFQPAAVEHPGQRIVARLVTEPTVGLLEQFVGLLDPLPDRAAPLRAGLGGGSGPSGRGAPGDGSPDGAAHRPATFRRRPACSRGSSGDGATSNRSSGRRPTRGGSGTSAAPGRRSPPRPRSRPAGRPVPTRRCGAARHREPPTARR